jgi:hypothetical protein
MARGGRLPRTAGRPPRFLRPGHRRAINLSEAHLQAARRDGRHTLEDEAEGVLRSLLFHRASRVLRAQTATFRVLAERDSDVDAALASAVVCSPTPRSQTPPRPPLSQQKSRPARRRGAAQIVRERPRGLSCQCSPRQLLRSVSGSIASLAKPWRDFCCFVRAAVSLRSDAVVVTAVAGFDSDSPVGRLRVRACRRGVASAVPVQMSLSAHLVLAVARSPRSAGPRLRAASHSSSAGAWRPLLDSRVQAAFGSAAWGRSSSLTLSGRRV